MSQQATAPGGEVEESMMAVIKTCVHVVEILRFILRVIKSAPKISFSI